MTSSGGSSGFLKSSAVRDAITHLADVNGVSGFQKGWIPRKHDNLDGIAGSRGPSAFAANLAMAMFAMFIVAGRVYTRACVAGGLGGDDYAIVMAVLVLIASVGMLWYGIYRAGFGKHILDLEVDEILSLLKITYAMPLIQTLGIYLIKMSLLLFYRRLFGPVRYLQRIVTGFIWFETIHLFGSSIGLVFICSPVDSWWNILLRADNCPNFHQTMMIYVSLRAVSVVTDVLVLFLPMKLVWDLKMPVKQKVGLASVFGLGALTCIAAIVRLAFLPELLLSLDFSWNIIPVALLGRAEQCLGMITVSIPALTALISKSRGRLPPQVGKGSASSCGLSDPRIANPSIEDFDFLAYAYDPDKAGAVFAIAYAGNKPSLHVGFRSSSSENLVELEDGIQRWLEPGTISKTTTVQVMVSGR